MKELFLIIFMLYLFVGGLIFLKIVLNFIFNWPSFCKEKRKTKEELFRNKFRFVVLLVIFCFSWPFLIINGLKNKNTFIV